MLQCFFLNTDVTKCGALDCFWKYIFCSFAVQNWTMYLPESPFTQAAKVALMSAAWVRCNVDSCEIPFDSNNQSENILPI